MRGRVQKTKGRVFRKCPLKILQIKRKNTLEEL